MSRFFIVLTAVVSIALGIFGEETMAHSLFKKSMEKSYPVMKVSCNACHVKGEKKSVRTLRLTDVTPRKLMRKRRWRHCSKRR